MIITRQNDFHQNGPGSLMFPCFQRSGQSWIRTNEGVSQRIYSPPRLATSVSARVPSGACVIRAPPSAARALSEDLPPVARRLGALLLRLRRGGQLCPVENFDGPDLNAIA